MPMLFARASKLIRICDELNSCLEHSNYFAITSLVRMILDHIPPILGYSSFKEVANIDPVNKYSNFI